jgi:hypothetical protein
MDMIDTASASRGSAPGPRWSRRVASAPTVCALAAFCVYFVTLAPTVTSEDSGELIAAAHCFGVPHPPGYPLWTMLCGFFIHTFPSGSAAWKANLLSAIFAAGGVALLCHALLLLGIRPIIGASAARIVGFGSAYWSQSVITEVYALNAFLFAALLCLAVAWWNSKNRRLLLYGVAVTGLGMCNHHTIGLSAAAFATWILVLNPRLLGDFRLILKSVAIFLITLLPYAYLPIRAMADPPVNWGEARTWRAAWEHVSRKQYRGRAEQPHAELSKPGLLTQLRTFGGYCLHEHTPSVFVLVLFGMVVLAFRTPAVFALLMLLTISHSLLFMAMQGVGTSRQDVWASKVFFIPQYMLAAIPLALHAEPHDRVRATAGRRLRTRAGCVDTRDGRFRPTGYPRLLHHSGDSSRRTRRGVRGHTGSSPSPCGH